MSLADLKKQNFKKEKRDFTIEEFIDDATNYAMGKPEVVNARFVKETNELSQSIKKSVEHKPEKSYKHATFTLTDDIIVQLNDLSKTTKIPKSRLLRILVNQFYNEQNPVELHLSKVP